ncbi:RHS repeat-associated core domain-containing protein [Collimonas humicola]|uniref:RHS repeat-associated core domain-containing protein n=1 Tax=Collimonas humicola TaxID=2825886 RepID=UPI001B8ABEDC|nr:RHS repeat-associated core domain-containing protein [Collimonas humicola]
MQPVPAAGGTSPTVSFTYDGQDQLSTVTDPRNLVTSYAVDGLGNQNALTSPDTGSTSKTYDAAGNLKTRTDARGKTTTYSYDALNRLTQISYASGTATQFEYDGGTSGAPNAKGHLTRMVDGSGQTTYAYDGFGRLLTKVQTLSSTGASSTLSYGYGSSGTTTGKLISTTYPSGNRINYGYDAAGRINSLTLNPTNTTGGDTNTGSTIPLLTGIGYQAFGPVNAWTWGNSSSTSTNTYARGIDLDGRVISYPLGNALSNGTNRTISYDAASRITATSHSGTGTGNSAPANFNQSYGYDNLDRLNSVTGSSSTSNQSFQYDQNGNRTQATFGSGSYANTIAANSNQLTATTGPTPAKSNTYDAAGNLSSDSTISYTYSDRGRMVSATNAGNTVTYIHNGIDQRVQKQGPTSIIATGSNSYMYDSASHLIGEYDANQQVIEETVYLGSLPVAVLKQATTGTGSSQSTATNIYYVYADHINTPRVITQATDNQMVWRWDNADPFGLQPPDENPSSLGAFAYNQRFPGQLYDKETNNFYNINRDYDPQQGRYVQSDPIGLGGGVNTYAYTNANPMSNTDATGLSATTYPEPEVSLPSLSGLLAQLRMLGTLGATISLAGDTRIGDCECKTFIVYRGDRASQPPNIVFNSGFSPKGNNMDLLKHAQGSPDSGYVPTSRSQGIAEAFSGKNGYVYKICSPRGVDVNRALGAKSPYPEQQEMAMPGGISGGEVMGAYPQIKGIPSNTYVPNPNCGCE